MPTPKLTFSAACKAASIVGINVRAKARTLQLGINVPVKARCGEASSYPSTFQKHTFGIVFNGLRLSLALCGFGYKGSRPFGVVFNRWRLRLASLGFGYIGTVFNRGRRGLASLGFRCGLVSGLVLVFAQWSGFVARGQNIEGQIIASQYGQWQVPGFAADTYSFAPGSCRVQGGASFFFAFTVGTPVSIVDANPALTETVTPTAIVDSNVSCSITIAAANTHQLPFHITSATGGLQEAINENLPSQQNNTIILDSSFYRLVGGAANATAVIAGVQGSTKLGLVDVTTAPTTWYQWNGTQYTQVGSSDTGGGNGGGGTEGGGGIGGTTGALHTLVNDLLANGANGSGAKDLNDFVTGDGFTPQNAVDAAAAHGGVATLTPNAGDTPFSNTHSATGVKVDDLDHLGATYRSVTEFGAQCDTRQTGVSLTQGSTSIGIFFDFFYVYDVGKTLTVVGTVGGVPTAFETKIVSLVGTGPGYATAVMATPAPFTLTGSNKAVLGHDDTAAIAAALTAVATNQQSGATFFQAVQFPGGNCLSHTIVYNGVSMAGINGGLSQVTGFPGEDVFAEPDPAKGSSGEGNSVHIHDMTWNVDNRIDATQAWQILDDTGTHAKTPVYRPTGIRTALSNNPVAPGWFEGSGANGSGAYNGVAQVSDGSAVICTPATLTQPVVGNTIVFPYLATVFTTTVASTAGSCAAGSTARTLSAAMPAGSASTQAEWFAGTSVQTLRANVSGAACPSSITLTNSVLPSPAAESNVAPFGLIQIDGEQFSYFGKTGTGTLGSGYYLTITGCAQNGTARAAHSAGATVVPLNQYNPAIPWPVAPTVNSNATTPLNAAFYPAWNVGNAAFAAPDSDGNQGLVGIGSFANSVLNSLYINAWPTSTAINNTAGFYLVGLPYASGFDDITIAQTTFGIHEGTPSLNTGGSWANAQPTADGTHWENIRISSCNVSDLISGGQNSFKDWNTYSGCTNTAGATLGANTCFLFSQGWNDQANHPQAIQGNVDLHNMYCEPEFGSQYGLVPVFEWDLSIANWDNLHMGGGGETYLGGNNQHFQGGNFNNQALFPVINYGYGNGSDGTQWLAWGNGVGNVYGTNSFINYGPNSHFSGATSKENPRTSPYGAQQMGNSREPWSGQSNETFNTGNTTAPYVNSNGGYIPAWEIAVDGFFECCGFKVPWAYDASSPSGGSVGCFMSTDGGAACFSYLFNEAGIAIGPGQRLAAGKYVVHVASKSLTGAATSYQIKVGACGLGDSGTFNIPVTTSWPAPDVSFEVDFTGKAMCGGGTPSSLSMDFIFPTPNNDTIYVAYVDFAPVAETITAQTINVTTIHMPGGSPTGGSATGCSQSPVVGIDGGYVCPVSGWTADLAAIEGLSDTVVTLNTIAGVAGAGCFVVDSEIECYTGLTGMHLTGVTRGAYGTAAATHNMSAEVQSENVVLGAVGHLPPAQLQGGGGAPVIFAIRNPFPQSHANQSVFSVNAGGNETWMDTFGAMHQTYPFTNNQLGTTTIGALPAQPSITNSGYLLQTNGQNTAYQPLALGGGHAGSLNIVAPATIAAPTGFTSVASGSSSVSYVCSGTDFDENMIPGTTFTVNGIASSWAFPASNYVQCPWAAGVNTYQIYRTVGGVNQGLIFSGPGPGAYTYDFDGTASAGSPPVVNGSNPHLSVVGTGTPGLQLGPTNISTGAGAPTLVCGTAPIGSGSLWLRTDGGASTSVYSCAGSTWTAVVIP